MIDIFLQKVFTDKGEVKFVGYFLSRLAQQPPSLKASMGGLDIEHIFPQCYHI